MAKHRSRSNRNQPLSEKSLTIQLPLPVLGVLTDTRQAFHELCIETGQHVLMAMMEADREALCGAKDKHVGERRAWRGGSARSRVTLGGRQVEMPRLRVRTAEGELGLASFQWAAATEPMEAHTMEAIAAGVSTRKYRRTLESLPSGVAEHVTSSSAVSRRFVALSSRRMHEFLSRALDELDIRVVFIDGKVFRDHCMLIALGLDSQGRKHVLGLREGSTENAPVARALLSDLVERGLPINRSMLFIIDGAKALRRARGEGAQGRASAMSTGSSVWSSVVKFTSSATSWVICLSPCMPVSLAPCVTLGRANRLNLQNANFSVWFVPWTVTIRVRRLQCARGSRRH